MCSTQAYACSSFSPGETSSRKSSLILLCGDNQRTLTTLHRVLGEQNFLVQFTGYDNLLATWKQDRHPIVLLEVQGPQSVERAIKAALDIKHLDSNQFVGYLADPDLQAYAGLAGDGIFSRNAEELAHELKQQLKLES
jgi:hypothetical protein